VSTSLRERIRKPLSIEVRMVEGDIVSVGEVRSGERRSG
jgi:hypothetical protein